jgi:hypothetical protein
VRGEPTLEIIRVNHLTEVLLADVVDAGRALAAELRAGQCRKQRAREDGDDGNDDEQLDQGKATQPNGDRLSFLFGGHQRAPV